MQLNPNGIRTGQIFTYQSKYQKTKQTQISIILRISFILLMIWLIYTSWNKQSIDNYTKIEPIQDISNSYAKIKPINSTKKANKILVKQSKIQNISLSIQPNDKIDIKVKNKLQQVNIIKNQTFLKNNTQQIIRLKKQKKVIELIELIDIKDKKQYQTQKKQQLPNEVQQRESTISIHSQQKIQQTIMNIEQKIMTSIQKPSNQSQPIAQATQIQSHPCPSPFLQILATHQPSLTQSLIQINLLPAIKQGYTSGQLKTNKKIYKNKFNHQGEYHNLYQMLESKAEWHSQGNLLTLKNSQYQDFTIEHHVRNKNQYMVKPTVFQFVISPDITPNEEITIYGIHVNQIILATNAPINQHFIAKYPLSVSNEQRNSGKLITKRFTCVYKDCDVYFTFIKFQTKNRFRMHSLKIFTSQTI